MRTIHLKTDIDRYGTIAERWPAQISITGTDKQLLHFLYHGVYEAGCDELLIPADENSEKIQEEIYSRRKELK